MIDRPLVSVLTPTWQRHDLVLEAIENVRAQTYRPLEHIVVSDGPDAVAYDLVDARWCEQELEPDQSRTVPLRVVALGRNWSTFLPNAYAAAPTTVAMLLARGQYQTWLADDERMTPDHVETLVDALEAAGADFAYGGVLMHRVGQSPDQGYVIGTNPPQHGQITNCLYRTDLLKRGLYVVGDDRASDWATIERWMAQGATWAFVDRVTLTHRVDR